MWKQYLLGLAVSLLAGWLFVEAVPLSEMGAALAGMNPWWLIPNILIYAGVYAVRAWRWHYLMLPVAEVPFRPLLSALMIGFLGNNLLPAHLGEFVRAVALGGSQGVSKSATFATVVLERIYDGLTVLLFLLLVLTFMDLPGGAVAGTALTTSHLRQAGWAGLVLFGGLLVVLQLFRWQQERALKVCRLCLRPAPARLSEKLLVMIDAFGQGLATARPRDLGAVGLYSLVTWLGLGLWAWSLFPAFGLELSPWAGVLMEVVVALALLIPSAPAFVGTFHLAAAATLAFLGAPAAVAGSYALVLWVVHFVITTLWGVYFLWRQGLGLGFLTGGRRG